MLPSTRSTWHFANSIRLAQRAKRCAGNIPASRITRCISAASRVARTGDADRFSYLVRKCVGKRLTYAELTGKTEQDAEETRPEVLLDGAESGSDRIEEPNGYEPLGSGIEGRAAAPMGPTNPILTRTTHSGIRSLMASAKKGF